MTADTTTNGHTNGTSKPLNIVIVGGSLAGLFAGVALKTLGHTSTILERNPTPLLQNQGAGIVAGGDTLSFFQQYDRCGRTMAVESQKRMYLNRTGEVVHEVTMRQCMTSWDLAYFLLRANYDGVEGSGGYVDRDDVPKPKDGDGGVSYLYGCSVTGLEESGGIGGHQDRGKVAVRFRCESGDDAESRDEILLADLVVGADGPSSTVRKLFCPDVQRTMAGYCALRGTVPELEVSDAAREVFVERFTFFHGPGTQILAYLIPGPKGTVKAGERLVNFVWYSLFPVDGKEFEELMTDEEGVRHRITLPPGKMRKSVWEKQIRVAQETLPPQFAEIISKTKKPFAQAITDVISPTNGFMDGKVLLIGDALAGFRPHTVASTSQAAHDAMVLADYVSGKIGREEFLNETMKFARLVQDRGVKMGKRSQFEHLDLSEHIADRDRASVPREEEVYPSWTEL